MTYPVAKLGDVARFIRGITFKPDDVVPVGTDDAIVCMRTKNVQSLLDCDDLLAVPERFVRRQDQFLEEGDVLVSSANSWNLVGKCCWVPSLPWRAAFGGFISVLRADPSKIEKRYLYWWFACDHTQALLRSFGQKTTNISNLNIERCLQLELPLPPLPEQRRIAVILDKADALRTKRREALAQLDRLEQSIFVEMFGDPVTNTHGWKLVSFDEFFVDVTSSCGKIPSSNYKVAGKFPVVDQGKKIIAGFCDDESLVAEVRLPVTVFGDHTRIIKHIDFPFVVGADGAKILICSEGINPRFATSLLSIFPIPNLGYSRHMKELRRISFILPPRVFQDDFERRLVGIDRVREKCESGAKASDSLISALMHRSFNGGL